MCHTGADTCLPPAAEPGLAFLAELDALIAARDQARPDNSCNAELFAAGTSRIAQKVAEETALAALSDNKETLLDESADLFYHLLVLLRARDLNLSALSQRLCTRHRH